MSERLLNLFAPEYCVGCNAAGSALCAECSLEMQTDFPDVCYRCNKLSGGNQTCVSCRSSTPIFSLDFVSHYEKLPKELIRSSKFVGSRSAIRTMAEIMNDSLPIREVDYVTFVPTATSSVRRRGLDHALLLSRRFAELRGEKHRRLLARKLQTRQLGAGRLRRKNQLKDAFRARQQLDGQTVLIIDDVVSTGASLENCTKALRQAGAKRVYAAVFAKNTG